MLILSLLKETDVETVGKSSEAESHSMSDELDTRLDRLEALLLVLVERQTVKDHYSVEEFAAMVNREPYTVREWCRLGRIKAEKKQSGRGKHPLWVIAHAEVLRYEKEGLLPFRSFN